MNWYVNDASLTGQFKTSDEFLSQLNALLELRKKNKLLERSLFCSRSLSARPAVGTTSIREVIIKTRNNSLKKLFLMWLDMRGPFWDDSRFEVPGDCFELHDEDVTEQGAGEAARQLLVGHNASTYSFSEAEPSSSFSPLKILQMKDDSSIASIEVINIWELKELEKQALAALPLPQNWPQALEQARVRFHKLNLVDSIEIYLKAQPYSKCIVDRMFELLYVLQQFVESRDEQGKYTNHTNELISDYFSGGDNALFTDESSSNKDKFKEKLTFESHLDSNVKVFCPWHGKIKTREFRIHFEFPMDASSKKLNIYYIGPKITKK